VSAAIDIDNCLKKARAHADSVYAAALASGTHEFQKSLAALRSRWAADGMVISGGMAMTIAAQHGKRIDELLQARVDGLLEGCELHSVPVDDGLASSMIDEILKLKENLIQDAQQSANQSTDLGMGIVKRDQFGQLVRSESKISGASLRVQIDRRRFSHRENKGMNIVYQVSGYGRVNVNSIDNSTNIVTVSSDQIFAKMQEVIKAGVPDGSHKDDILERLTALESAQSSPSFAKQYIELLGVAADHMTLLSPFLPALAEMAGRWLT
jgi:hypothetical protein